MRDLTASSLLLPRSASTLRSPRLSLLLHGGRLHPDLGEVEKRQGNNDGRGGSTLSLVVELAVGGTTAATSPNPRGAQGIRLCVPRRRLYRAYSPHHGCLHSERLPGSGVEHHRRRRPYRR
uniref:Uncharacterized protein n=1 Tax=Arundo donax TaxID=35708 RepID=A0A0A9GVL8_ARUDO